jgi:hypothetical protein
MASEAREGGHVPRWQLLIVLKAFQVFFFRVVGSWCNHKRVLFRSSIFFNVFFVVCNGNTACERQCLNSFRLWKLLAGFQFKLQYKFDKCFGVISQWNCSVWQALSVIFMWFLHSQLSSDNIFCLWCCLFQKYLAWTDAIKVNIC